MNALTGGLFKKEYFVGQQRKTNRLIGDVHMAVRANNGADLDVFGKCMTGNYRFIAAHNLDFNQLTGQSAILVGHKTLGTDGGINLAIGSAGHGHDLFFSDPQLAAADFGVNQAPC